MIKIFFEKEQLQNTKCIYGQNVFTSYYMPKSFNFSRPSDAFMSKSSHDYATEKFLYFSRPMQNNYVADKILNFSHPMQHDYVPEKILVFSRPM